MKVGGLTLRILRHSMISGDAKMRGNFPPHNRFEERLDIPYIDDGEDRHKFDLYFASKDDPIHKKALIIDIHGGGFIQGWRKNNFAFGLEFLRRGYDFAAIDYLPVQKGRSVGDLVSDCARCLSFIASHKEELGLQDDRIVMSGDSAGGLLALLMQIANDSPSYAERIGANLTGLNSRAVLLNCPVYDICGEVTLGGLTKSGIRYMFGPRSKDTDYMALYSPKSHIDKLSSPIFISTCAKDFIRANSEEAFLDLAKRDDLLFQRLDIDDLNVGHVHNIIDPANPSSVQVNEAMMKFIDHVLSK